MAGTGTGTILYLSEGHEYNPPLFHGALQLALNATSGQLGWSNLGFDDTATAVADGILTTFNSYDGQIYAYGQGPSQTTVSAPSVGVTTVDANRDKRHSDRYLCRCISRSSQSRLPQRTTLCIR